MDSQADADYDQPEWERQLLSPPLLYDGGTLFRDIPPVDLSISRHNLSLIAGVLSAEIDTLDRVEKSLPGGQLRGRINELAALRMALLNS